MVAGIFDLYVCSSGNVKHLALRRGPPERKKYYRDLNEILGAEMMTLLIIHT
jgi:hypothetical protein